MIQSTNPACIRGMRVLIPSPAGVIAPVRLIATVTLGSSIRPVKRWQASRSRPALYARKALSMRSAAVSAPVIGGGAILVPRRKLAEGRVIGAEYRRRGGGAEGSAYLPDVIPSTR